MAMATSVRHIAKELANAVSKTVSRNRGWYGPHMASAARAIAQRLPLVDLILEIRDARIPLSSEYELLRMFPPPPPPPSKRIVVLNKIDLANPARRKEWESYFEQENYISYGVNAHNKDSVKGLLNSIQAQVRELNKANCLSSGTVTVMLVGIPNVGKSALANSLHQIGRISAAEKGKLKHAVVSPQPGETKDISSLKIGSHPNIYVLDTPGILPPTIYDAELCAKLALTGAIQDDLLGIKELVQYFLGILNLDGQYKKWEKLSTDCGKTLFTVCREKHSSYPDLEMRRKKIHLTDHTQDFIVHDVRRTLFNVISSFDGNLDCEDDMVKLMEAQFVALRDALHVSEEINENVDNKVAVKLINLFRTGRLGHYTLDPLPTRARDHM